MMIWSKLVFFLICCLPHVELTNTKCEFEYWEPFKYHGDVTLGVFVPIHNLWEFTHLEKPNVTQLGFKFLEAILSTLDEVNSRKNYLNYTLGAVVYDTYSDAEVALRQALSFIGLNLSLLLNDGCPAILPQPEVEKQPITALIGPAYSEVSLSVANLLKLFYVPQVSYYSAAPKLSIIGRYPTFYRTVPSVIDAIKTLVYLLEKYHWNYVNLIVDNTDYGESNHGAIMEAFRKSNYTLCVSKRIQLRDAHNVRWEVEKRMLDLMNSSAVVNLLLTSPHYGALALEAVSKWPYEHRGHFLWIGTNSIEPDFPQLPPNNSQTTSPNSSLTDKMENILLILPRLQHSQELSQYNVNLSRYYGNNTWREEYLMAKCSCIPKGTETVQKFPIRCTVEQEQRCIDLLNYDKVFYVPNTVNAVLSVAESLKKIQDSCGSEKPCPPDGSGMYRRRILDVMSNISFYGFGREMFSFTDDGDGRPEFTILVRMDNENRWQTFAECDASKSTTTCKVTESVMKHVTTRYPYSRCQELCQLGSSTTYVKQDPCCWKCTECSKDAVVEVAGTYHAKDMPNATICSVCAPGTRPNLEQTLCVSLPLDFMSIADPSAIAMCTLCLIAIIISTMALAIYLRNWNTPVIRASGRETTLVLFVGIFFSYITPIVVLSYKPTVYICFWATIAPGLCSTISYAAIYVKINRIDRIFRLLEHTIPSTKRFINPQSQLLFMGLFVGLEVILLTVTMTVWPPSVTQILSGSKSYLGPRRWEQNGSVLILPGLDTNPVICFSRLCIPQFSGMLLPLFLMLASLLHAYKIRKVPYGYNEARQLGVVNYVNLLLIITVPILMMTFQLTSRELLPLSGLTFLMATNHFVVLILPKLYIILFTPEKNTTDKVLQRDRSKTEVRCLHLINELNERYLEGLSTISAVRCRHALGGLHELSAVHLVGWRTEETRQAPSRKRAVSLDPTNTDGENMHGGTRRQLRPRYQTTGHSTFATGSSVHGTKTVTFRLNNNEIETLQDKEQHVPLLQESTPTRQDRFITDQYGNRRELQVSVNDTMSERLSASSSSTATSEDSDWTPVIKL